MPVINNFITKIIEPSCLVYDNLKIHKFQLCNLAHFVVGGTACFLLTVALCRLGKPIITMVCAIYIYVSSVCANTYMHVCVPICVCLCVSICVCLHVLFQMYILCLVYI